jgi:hypothetical protein
LVVDVFRYCALATAFFLTLMVVHWFFEDGRWEMADMAVEIFVLIYMGSWLSLESSRPTPIGGGLGGFV